MHPAILSTGCIESPACLLLLGHSCRFAFRRSFTRAGPTCIGFVHDDAVDSFKIERERLVQDDALSQLLEHLLLNPRRAPTHDQLPATVSDLFHKTVTRTGVPVGVEGDAT